MEILVQEFIHGIKVKVRKQCALRISQKKSPYGSRAAVPELSQKTAHNFSFEKSSQKQALFLPDEGVSSLSSQLREKMNTGRN